MIVGDAQQLRDARIGAVVNRRQLFDGGLCLSGVDQLPRVGDEVRARRRRRAWRLLCIQPNSLLESLDGLVPIAQGFITKPELVICFHEGRVELNGLLGMRNGRFDIHLPVSDARKPVSIDRIGRARLLQPFEFGPRPIQPADCHV